MSSAAVHCKVCNVKFESKHILLAHINLHIGRKCKNCNKFFKSTIPENLLNSYDSKCKEFHVWISQQSLLKQSEPSPPPKPIVINNTPRYVRKYLPEEILQCQYCSYSTHCNTRFKKHMRCHTNERPFKCDKCDKRFTVRCNLKQHISSVHTKEKKFKCKHCGRGFIRSDRLKEHERIHTGEKPLKCPFCEEHFATSGRLNKHKKKHTGYKCRFCSKVYKTEYQLKQHKKADHAELIGDKPSNYIVGIRWFPHGCDFCGLRFLEKSLLDMHIKEHDGKICGKCNKLFESKEKMKEHEGKCTGPVEVVKKEVNSNVKALKAQTKRRSNKLLKLAITEGKEHYCLECDRCFPSGQSLGGHRASVHFKSRKSGDGKRRKVAKKKVKKKRKVIGKKEPKVKRIIKTRRTRLVKNKEKNEAVVERELDVIAPIDLDAMKNCEPDYLRHFDVSFKETEKDVINENKIVRNAYVETDGLPEVGMNNCNDLSDKSLDDSDEFDLNEKYLKDDNLNENDDEFEGDFMVNNRVLWVKSSQKNTKRVTRSQKKKPIELKSDKNCPGRHGLIQTVTADNSVCVCVECNKIMYLNEELYRCKWCDYDLCAPCFKGETKTNKDGNSGKEEVNECKTMRCDYSDKENKNKEMNGEINGNGDNKKRKRENEKNENKNNIKSAPARKKRKLIIKIPRNRKKAILCNKK